MDGVLFADRTDFNFDHLDAPIVATMGTDAVREPWLMTLRAVNEMNLWQFIVCATLVAPGPRDPTFW